MPISLPLNSALGTLFVVLVVMLLAPIAAEKLRLPSLFGLVLAGILIGPSGFRLIAGGANIEHAGSIATAYIFFLVGIGIDASQIGRGSGARMGARILLASGILGFLSAFFLLGLPPLPSLFIAVLFGSETALSPSAREKNGLSGSEAAVLVDSSLSLTDLARTGLFALLAAAARPSSSLHWGASLGLTLAAALLIVLVMPRLAALFFRRAKPNESVELLFILLLVFASAYACSLAGLEASTGTFLAGLLLGRFIPSGSSLNKRLRFAGELVFMPLFLIVFGMDLDIRAALASPAFPALLALCLALAFGARLALLLPGEGASRNERIAAYGLALGQGGSTLALVFLAERLGLAGGAFSLAAAIACIATSFSAPFIARAARSRLEAGAAGPAAGSRHPRIMVALANPASLRGLMELAMALRKKESREPLIPLTIVPEADESEVELAKAENLLAKAIVQANAADVPVSPETRVAVNAAEGIKRAAAEFGAGVLVLGWNRARKLTQAFSGNIAARVIEERRELVIVAKLGHPLKESQRAALILPPLVDKHPGFESGLSALLPLLSRGGARLTIYSTSPNGSAAKQASVRLRSRSAAQIVELAAWKDLARATRGEAPSLFVIFCPRPGNALWHPAIEKLPHLLGEDFPEASILLFYLAEAQAPEAAGEAKASEKERNLFDEASEAGRVMVNMEETAITDGIKALLSRDFASDRKRLGRLTSRFTEIAQKEPIELEPGVLLLHAHVPDIEGPRVYFGARPAGFRILALEEPVRVIVVLCAPEGQGPEAHLKVLGEIAGLFTEKGLKERLLSRG